MVQMKKRTKGATGSRRSHHALKPKAINKCSKCGKAVQPHRACPDCGTYRFVEAVKVKAPKAAK